LGFWICFLLLFGTFMLKLFWSQNIVTCNCVWFWISKNLSRSLSIITLTVQGIYAYQWSVTTQSHISHDWYRIFPKLESSNNYRYYIHIIYNLWNIIEIRNQFINIKNSHSKYFDYKIISTLFMNHFINNILLKQPN